jgi:uncharacterized protein
MSDSTADSVLAPTAPGERIPTLDVLRGFALLGIALVNVEFFSRPLQDINAPGIDPATSGADYFVEWLTYFFVQGKFWTMFALLFGMGFTVMIDRADRAGRPFVPAYLRRSLALLGIGLVHTVLIWSGDILVSYAVGALLLLLARQVRRAWLRRSRGREPEPMTASRMGGWGAALYGLPLVVILLAGMLDSPPSTSQPTRAQTEHATRVAEKAVQRANAVEAYSRGSFADAVDQRIVDTVWQMGTLPIATFWVIGLFLIGGALLRSGAISSPQACLHWLGPMRNVGLPLGFVAMAISTWLGTASPNEELSFREAVQVVLFLVASLVLALAYGATLVMALPGSAGRWLKDWLAPAGRMALSNYLMQSLIGTLLFYGYGLALWGQVGRAWQAVGVLAVFALQMLGSRWWLARFRYGPLEWAWRCITYGRAVPIRG